MAKKKIMKLSQGLVLNRYLLSMFGCTEFEQMAIHLRASNLEGYDEENISKFHTAIKLWLNSDKLSKDLLLEYDQNIFGHTLSISEYRDNIINWKYFQYVTLLFTEIYLDMYFSNSKKLLSDLNQFVDEFNDPLNDKVPNKDDFIAQKFSLNRL